MNKIKLNINYKFRVFILVFIILLFLLVYKFILFIKLKSSYNEKDIILQKKIENYNNYIKNKNQIVKLNNLNKLNLIKFEEISYVILEIYNNLDIYKINKNKVDIGYKEFVDKYMDNDIIKIPVKINCYGEYKNLIKYIKYLESIDSTIIIENLTLILDEEKSKIEKFNLNIELSILTIVGQDNE